MNEKYKSLLDKNKINTSLRLAHFFAQLDHESGLKPISENLNYSSSGLIRIFRKYFTDLEAIQFQRQPQRIANRVYANRMGNGNEASGDGWKYRGRGFIQITGKENYAKLSKATGIDFVNNPDLLLQETNSMISACWFWNTNKLSILADRNDIVGITRRINGGLNGLEDRKQKLVKWTNIVNK
jgi:putative chitinase